MKTQKPKHYRQGDVLIERIEKLPDNLKKQSGRIILAHGEATGHHHAIEDRDAADWWKTADQSGQFVEVKEKVQVTHQEHAPIELPPGTYRVTRQREYSPEAIRNVAD